MIFLLSCSRFTSKHPQQDTNKQDHRLLLGIDSLEENDFAELQGKSIAVVVNQTSLDSAGRHLVDMLLEKKDEISLKVIFTPEHGLKGLQGAGEWVEDGRIEGSGVRIISLYGKKKTPSGEDLAGIDLIVVDLQDVGSRYYTYISTLTNVMTAAAQNDKKVLLLDRPNPLGGEIVEGPLVKPGFESFVGMHPIPIRYGMTLGELAKMINERGWLGSSLMVDLDIIPLAHWQREMLWPQTDLNWVPTSPNIPDFATALIYDGMCLLEGTNLSEGRGTPAPFLTFGAPWINSEQLTTELTALMLPGVSFSTYQFVPVSIPDKAPWPKYEGENCHGCRIVIKDPRTCDPLLTAVSILETVHRDYQQKFEFLDTHYIDKLYGSANLRRNILQGRNAAEIVAAWKRGESSFRKNREKYLLY